MAFIIGMRAPRHIAGCSLRCNTSRTRILRDRSKRALALIAAAFSDAAIAAWDSKHAYNRPHPSCLDPSVAPVVAVPRSPSYRSEHAVTAGAAAAVLSYLFPDEASKLSDTAYQAPMSRVMAGVAFPSDVLSGLDQTPGIEGYEPVNC